MRGGYTVKLTYRPEVMSADAQQAMYKAIVDFVHVEYVEGSCEGGQSCEFRHASLSRRLGSRRRLKNELADDPHSPPEQACLYHCAPLPQCLPQLHLHVPSPFPQPSRPVELEQESQPVTPRRSPPH